VSRDCRRLEPSLLVSKTTAPRQMPHRITESEYTYVFMFDKFHKIIVRLIFKKMCGLGQLYNYIDASLGVGKKIWRNTPTRQLAASQVSWRNVRYNAGLVQESVHKNRRVWSHWSEVEFGVRKGCIENGDTRLSSLISRRLCGWHRCSCVSETR
jgi:hypothetical protein